MESELLEERGRERERGREGWIESLGTVTIIERGEGRGAEGRGARATRAIISSFNSRCREDGSVSKIRRGEGRGFEVGRPVSRRAADDLSVADEI